MSDRSARPNMMVRIELVVSCDNRSRFIESLVMFMIFGGRTRQKANHRVQYVDLLSVFSAQTRATFLQLYITLRYKNCSEVIKKPFIFDH